MNAHEYQTMFTAEDRHWWYVGLRHEINRHLARVADARPPGSREPRWLDAGCGTGGLLAHLVTDARVAGERPPWWAVGIELSWEGLSRSRTRRISHLLQGSVNALPFQTNTFDVITSIDVLYHANVDESQALQECHRVLKPGGWLILHLPAFEWLRSKHDAALWTRRRYARSDVEMVLQAAGFRTTHLYYRNSLLFPVLAVMRLGQRHCAHVPRATSDVYKIPPIFNAVLTHILKLESALAARSIRLPFGLSILCVAERTGTT